jgi:dihydrofolate reductase
MRRVRYSVAVSLDGYVAGPKGEADWIVTDPEIDFRTLYDQFDTVFIGRRTYEIITAKGAKGGGTPGMKTYVFSKTLKQKNHPGVIVVARKQKETVEKIKAEKGKDVWLFGGGALFRSLLALGCVDTVEVAVIPVILGDGIPMLPPPAKRTKLKLTGQKVYPKTGTVSLEYAVK